MAETYEKYRTAVMKKGHDLIARMNRLGICTDESHDPQRRLESLADLLAHEDELDLDQRIYSNLTLDGQVDAICSSLKARSKLCRLCLTVSEGIAAIPERRDRFGLDGFWPPREFGPLAMDSFTDGIRLLPPETVPEGSKLPFNVIRHQPDGATLLASAQDCPFCELLRIAIILDSFRKYGFPLDRPTSPLPDMLMAIRQGGENDEFNRVLEGIRASQNSVYVMDDGSSAESGTTLEHLRVVWQKPKSLVDREGDRKVVFTKLKVFQTGMLHRSLSRMF